VVPSKAVICLASCLSLVVGLSLTTDCALATKPELLKSFLKGNQLYRQGQYEKALEILERLEKVEEDPSAKAGELDVMAQCCMQTNQHAKAIKYLRELHIARRPFVNDPKSPYPELKQFNVIDYVHEAKCQFYLHDLLGSLKTLEVAGKLGPDNESVLFDRITVLTELGRNQDVVDNITRLLAVMDSRSKKKDVATHILTAQARRIELLYKRSKAYSALGQKSLALKDKLKADQLSEEY
jgi:tetratricopeptide (TPR) repeat protein